MYDSLVVLVLRHLLADHMGGHIISAPTHNFHQSILQFFEIILHQNLSEK